jgi:hypothetical protein
MMKKIVVDEAVSEESGRQFHSFLRKKGYDGLDILFLSKAHTGIPDSHIVYHLLDHSTFFLTTDKPLHNAIIAQDLKSYHCSHGKFNSKKIKGIKNKELTPLNKDALVLKENYHLPKTEIRPYLLPSAEKSLKKLRTKRRRIRNHFGGYDNLDLVALTVSWKVLNTSTLFGLKFRISTSIGKKALDASENSFCDQIEPQYRDIVAINYALILSIQFMLHGVETKVYFDSPKMTNPALHLNGEDQSPHTKLFATLHENFSDIEFIPSTKGRFIERLRAKLEDLSVGNSNEIVPGNMSEILDNVNSFYRIPNKEVI